MDNNGIVRPIINPDAAALGSGNLMTGEYTFVVGSDNANDGGDIIIHGSTNSNGGDGSFISGDNVTIQIGADKNKVLGSNTYIPNGVTNTKVIGDNVVFDLRDGPIDGAVAIGNGAIVNKSDTVVINSVLIISSNYLSAGRDEVLGQFPDNSPVNYVTAGTNAIRGLGSTTTINYIRAGRDSIL